MKTFLLKPDFWIESERRMKEREKIIATGLTILLLILWLGFMVHRSPRFAGSALGGLLAVTGSLLMLFPLFYMCIKRSKRLKKWVTKSVSMRTLLTLHVYAGIIGPILVLLHTGHKFNSLIGVFLTGLTLIVVLSGFVGRYMMRQFSTEIREKKEMLNELQRAFARAAKAIEENPVRAEALRSFTGIFSRVIGSLFVRTIDPNSEMQSRTIQPKEAIRLAEAIADVEYAIKTHEKFKTWFGKWLKIHIVLSFALYVLMAVHVYFAIYFGLRWFE